MKPRASTLAAVALLGVVALGCEQPQGAPQEKVDPPPVGDPDAGDLQAEAHAEALAAAIPVVREALLAIDPMSAYQAGLGPARTSPLDFAARLAVQDKVDAALLELDGIDEAHLDNQEIIALRVIRFGLHRAYDELTRRPKARLDPIWPMTVVGETLDEVQYRLLHGQCDANCGALPHELAQDLGSLPDQLEAASPTATATARARASTLADDARRLAERVTAHGDHGQLADNLEALATALDDHATWLATLEAALPNAEHQTWTAAVPPVRPGGVDSIERLPAMLGAATVARWLSVDERLDIEGYQAFAEIERHVARWRAIERQMLARRGEEQDAPTAAEVIAGDKPRPVDAERCAATLAELTADLAELPGTDPAPLDCDTFVALSEPGPRSDGELGIELLDLAIIEPNRRALRQQALPEIALIRGQWSTQVHLHLRRIMLLAKIDSLPMRAKAVDDGRRALCWAEAGLWVHGQLGPPDEVALTVGTPCKDLGDAQTITERVLADPAWALSGLGLSRIGNEPARMVGFDQFFWAPLGLMHTLATPPGMHPDEFELPSEAKASADAGEAGEGGKLEVQIEKL